MEIRQNTEIHGLVVNNIFEANEEQISILHEEAKKSGHKARVIVHPFYEVKDLKNSQTLAILRLLRSDSEQLPPIIIFEESDKVAFYNQINLKIPKGAGIYIVPTVMGAPHPTLGWKKLEDILKIAEIENILIGGRYLTYQDEMDGIADYQIHLKQMLENQGFNPTSTLAGCVGIAAGILSKDGFNIQLSNISDPLNPASLK